MTASETTDLGVYSVVHDMMKTSNEERRGRDRKNFPTVQMIAPYANGQLPTRDQFRPVRCQDLSTGGMAFFFEKVPDFEHLVVALSSNSQVIHLTAVVAHCKSVEVADETLVLVGCRFLGRVIL
jgi:hypothetical protein